MLEAYLFVDPLCKKCLKSERAIKELAKNLDTKLLYQFIPMLSIKILNKSNPPVLIKNHQTLYYQMVLDYKAALFQGKKRGQNFFITLQKEIIDDQDTYTNQLVLSTAENTRLDLDMFKEDRRSSLAKRAFKSDQKLIYEMNISKPASVVIFNGSLCNYGILFNYFNYRDFSKICQNKSPFIHDHRGIPIPHVNLH